MKWISGLKAEWMFGSRHENEKPENEKLNSRFTLIGPVLQASHSQARKSKNSCSIYPGKVYVPKI